MLSEKIAIALTPPDIPNFRKIIVTKPWWDTVDGLDVIVVGTAGQFGISAGRAQNYHADSGDVELNFRVMSEVVATFRECSAMPEGWNDEIQKDCKKQ